MLGLNFYLLTTDRLAAAVLASLVVAFSSGAAAQTAKRLDFSGDAAAEVGRTVKAEQLQLLKGVRAVVIPQFTVEFVERSDGLSLKEERRQDYVDVTYKLTPVSDADRQAITDKLYAHWVAGLQAQGLTVLGPRQAMATQAWTKLAAGARPAPAALERRSGLNRIFSVEGAPYIEPQDSAAPAGALVTGAKRASGPGALLVAGFAPQLGGALGAASGLGAMAGGMRGFGKSLSAINNDPLLAKETGAASMTVRLVVGLRETDMAFRGFGVFRTAGSYKGKPRFVVQGEGTQVEIVPPQPERYGGRARLTVTGDLTFAEDVLGGRLSIANSKVGTVSNVATRTLFVGAALVGGPMTMNQSHTFAADPEPAAYAAAIERNLSAVEDMVLLRLRDAW